VGNLKRVKKGKMGLRGTGFEEKSFTRSDLDFQREFIRIGVLHFACLLRKDFYLLDLVLFM